MPLLTVKDNCIVVASDRQQTSQYGQEIDGFGASLTHSSAFLLFQQVNPQRRIEILLDLFENYIRLIDIYLAFCSLNHRRINGIIKSARFCIDIPSKDIFHTKSTPIVLKKFVVKLFS